MNQLHEAILELLLEIDGICKEHGIEYYIDGGTALGGIRHRGFLPWDDDADLAFTRDNWEKFERAVLENPRPDRVLEDLHRNENYTMVYARYCDTSKTCILRTSMVDQFKSGLFIDMFVLDPIPDTPESRKEYFDVLYGYCEYLNPFYYDTIVGVNEWYDKFRKMGAKQGRQAVIDFVEKKLFSYPDEEGMAYALRYDNDRLIYPRDVIGRPRLIPFENVILPVPEKTEEYLRIHYGDNWYMIPSAAEAETHNVVIDLDVPYEQFKNSYMRYVDRAQAIQNYKRLHNLRTKHRRITESIDTTNYTTTAKLFAQMLSKRDARAECPMKKLLEQGDYQAVRERLANYFDTQLRRWFLYYRVYVPLEDTHLYCALYLLMVDGLYAKADKILALRREQGTSLTPELEQIEMLIGTIRDIARAFERSNAEEALRLSCQAKAEHLHIPQLTESELRARATLAIDKNDTNMADAVLKDLALLEEPLRSSHRLQAAKLFLLLRFGNDSQRQEAVRALQELSEQTFDGMLRLEIADALS